MRTTSEMFNLISKERQLEAEIHWHKTKVSKTKLCIACGDKSTLHSVMMPRILRRYLSLKKTQ